MRRFAKIVGVLLLVILFDALSSAQSERRALTLRAVIGDEKAPVVGAPVVFLDHEKADGGWAAGAVRTLFDADPATLRARATLTTGATGEFTIPVFRAKATIAVLNGDDFAITTIDQTTPTGFEMTLYRDRTLTVKVVGADRTPRAGIEVRAFIRGPTGSWDQRWETSDVAGIAVLRHLQINFEGAINVLKFNDMDATQSHVSIACGGAFPTVVGPQELPLISLVATPIEVVLSDLCRLNLRILDEKNSPFLDPVRADVMFQNPPEHIAKSLEIEGGGMRIPIENGVGGAWIAPGLTLQCDAADAMGEFAAEASDWIGPSTTEKSLDVTLTLSRRTIVVAGCTIAEDGSAIENALMTVSVGYERRDRPRERDGSLEIGRLVTGAAGAIELPLRDILAFVAMEPSASIKCISLEWTTESGAKRTSDIAFREWVPGKNDVGAIIFKDEQVLCGGTIVDTDGTPLPEARIRILRARDDRTPGVRDARGTEISHALADDEGRFSIPPLKRPMKVTLVAENDHYLPAEVSFKKPGTTGLRVVLKKAGSISGRLLLDDPNEHEAIDLVAIGAPATPDPLMPDRKWLRDYAREIGVPGVPLAKAHTRYEGTYTFEGLSAGTVTVEVRVRGAKVSPIRIPDVVIREGEASTDPRLKVIDLREKTTFVECTYKEKDEDTDAWKPVRDHEREIDILADVSPTDPPATVFTREASAEYFRTLNPVPPMIGRIAGFRWFRIAAGREKQEIIVRRGPKLAFAKFPKASDAKSDDDLTFALFEVTLIRSTEKGFETLAGDRAFQIRIPAEKALAEPFGLPGTGTYRIRLLMENKEGTEVPLVLGPDGAREQTVVVPEPKDPDDVILVTTTPDPKEIAALREDS